MSKAKNKTQPTNASVPAYINSIESIALRKEAKILLKLFKDVTNTSPVMWGTMIGFGNYHYVYDSGREGDLFATGFAIRKSGIVIYIMPGYQDYSKILSDLGPHKLGKACLYLKNLKDINLSVLQKLIKAGLRDLKKKYPTPL